MIGKKDPFIQILRTTNFTSHIEEYADSVCTSYDKMTLLIVKSRIEDLNKNVETQIKVNNAIKSLDDDKVYDKLSNKLKGLCDLLDTKFASRKFQEEANQASSSTPPKVEDKREDPPITTDV